MSFSLYVLIIVASYIYVFGSGLLGLFLLNFLIEDSSFPSKLL